MKIFDGVNILIGDFHMWQINFFCAGSDEYIFESGGFGSSL